MDKNKAKAVEKVVSFSAQKKWLEIPKEIREKIESNTFCASCMDVVRIVNYVVKETKDGIHLEGSCNKCGHKVARVID